MRVYILAGLALGVLMGGARVDAHHAFAAVYFEDQTVTIEGSITEIRFSNPHVWLVVEVQERDGVMRSVSAEWSNPGRLSQAGIQRTTLKPGDRVIIVGSPSRDASSGSVHLKGITRPADGWKWMGRGDRR
jgi:hypothetical protein